MLIVTLVTAGEEEFCARANLSSICREREKQKLVRNKQKEKLSICRYIELRNGINWIIFFFPFAVAFGKRRVRSPYNSRKAFSPPRLNGRDSGDGISKFHILPQLSMINEVR